MTALTDTRQDGIAGPLILALEQAWAEIRRRHPEVPAAVLITGSGSDARRNMLRLGHFAERRWQSDGAEIDEIFVGGEGLERGAGPVLATLLHEAAHALARVRGIQDTSRQGRYHNQRFKELGEELGLRIDKHPKIGWSTTTLPDDAARRYAGAIEQLDRAITIYRRRERGGGGGDEPARKPGPPPCVCGCGRRIRVAPGVLALGDIICAVCEQPFAPERPTRPKARREPSAITSTRTGNVAGASAARFEQLVAEACDLGYRVVLVEWVECADCPGLLGMAEGAIVYDKRVIRIRSSLPIDDRVRVLAHELEHARDPDADIETGPVWALTRTARRRGDV